MKLLIKFLIVSCIPCILPSVTFAEKLNNRSIPSALMEIRKPIIGQFYSCRYEIFYANLEEQKKFENDQTAKKNLPFIYIKPPRIIYQYEENPILQAPKNPTIHVNFDLKMDNKAHNISISPSTGSISLDKNIKKAFSRADFSTQKKFWWGDTLKFSDEITLKKSDDCKVHNMHDEVEISQWRKRHFS